MAPQKSPAFQFYAKDFQTGTASMSLQEVGAYIRLLAYQWDTGSVPNDANDRARILGCAKAQERELWKKIGKKFVLTDGVFLNERMEGERQKQTEYRRRQSDNGRASSLAKAHKRANGASTTVEPPLQPESNRASTEPQPALVPEGQPKGNSSLSGLQSSSSKKQEQQSPPPLITSPKEYERRKGQCAFVGSRLEVPHGLHADLRKALGGPDPDTALQAWYLAVNDEIDESGEAIAPDVFKWLKARYAQRFPPPPVNGTKRTDPALMARLQAIERGEIKR